LLIENDEFQFSSEHNTFKASGVEPLYERGLKKGAVDTGVGADSNSPTIPMK
jgi:hypothetical protein